MTVTDMEVIDILAATGPAAAGQLADLTGLTTGAITGMLNRLEEAGLVRRERDPTDGRRVIVRLASGIGTGKDAVREINAIFDSVGEAWEGIASHYDDEQIALLVEFLKRGSALSRQEIVRLREAPEGEEGIFSAPLGDLASGQLIASGVSRLTVRADDGMAQLYQARFEGPVPDVKARDGVVTIGYPRRLWALSGGQHSAAEVTLNADIPWRIVIKGGASDITAKLGGLNLAGLEVKGGMSMIRLELPAPSGVVPIRISGGASQITVRRPTGVAARARLTGWVSTFVFDDQTFSDVGSNVRLQSPGYEVASQRYDIEVSSSASMVTITSG
ncbi:MAG: MarR family transcriptional regulator [Ktedonobacterales bacterium]